MFKGEETVSLLKLVIALVFCVGAPVKLQNLQSIHCVNVAG